MSSINSNLPDYCDLYKFFLIEELVFIKNPVFFHYGKCVVIGQLHFEDSKYFLTNVRLKCLGSKYERSSGSISILLLPSTENQILLPIGRTVEVFAETYLWNKTKERSSSQLDLEENSLDIITSRYLGEIQNETETALDQPNCKSSGTTTEGLQPTNRSKPHEYLSQMKENLVPVLRIHHIAVIDRAADLIETNIRLRQITSVR